MTSCTRRAPGDCDAPCAWVVWRPLHSYMSARAVLLPPPSPAFLPPSPTPNPLIRPAPPTPLTCLVSFPTSRSLLSLKSPGRGADWRAPGRGGRGEAHRRGSRKELFGPAGQVRLAASGGIPQAPTLRNRDRRRSFRASKQGILTQTAPARLRTHVNTHARFYLCCRRLQKINKKRAAESDEAAAQLSAVMARATQAEEGLREASRCVGTRAIFACAWCVCASACTGGGGGGGSVGGLGDTLVGGVIWYGVGALCTPPWIHVPCFPNPCCSLLLSLPVPSRPVLSPSHVGTPRTSARRAGASRQARGLASSCGRRRPRCRPWGGRLRR